ncbi:MAG: hypothetical protein K8F91_17610 [Candidatus Obscuribacterales bacterium]|nr:hypothetical protein [Candidatus Obscuribacterales bacterium]
MTNLTNPFYTNPMNKYLLRLLSIAVATTVTVVPTYGKENNPLKVIAPDLVVESFECGEFPDGPKELDPANEHFVPKKKTRGGFIGYRLKLKTDRKEITWRRNLDKTS